jgi:PIN domain nuclease of toxin-antitoxin system
MRYLLDTHAFLWFVAGDPILGKDAERAIGDASSDIFVSIATLWEIAIKVSIGKLVLNEPLAVYLPREITRNNFQILPISIDHTVTVATLPFHHRDPFDRLLIAQALTERMPILSTDAQFDAYGVSRLW